MFGFIGNYKNLLSSLFHLQLQDLRDSNNMKLQEPANTHVAVT